MKPSLRYSSIADPTVVELLKLTEQPDVISFAGGTPSPQTLLADLVHQASQKAPTDLQYSPAQGTLPFRRTLARWLGVSPEEILVTSGSQQALDLVARTFINAHDPIFTADPTYFVALGAFNAYQPDYVTDVCAAKLAYVVPTFANPTGETLDSARRRHLALQIKNREAILIEDDPYRQLYFDSPPPPPIRRLLPRQTIYITSLSKVVGPALRLGIVVAPPNVISQLSLVKSSLDLCTSGWLQSLADWVISHPQFDSRLAHTRAFYRRQAQHLLKALADHMPPAVSWTQPTGGLFVWVTLPAHIDTHKLYFTALKRKVAFVPGYIFRPHRQKSSCLRLCFATASPRHIETGISRLAKLITQVL